MKNKDDCINAKTYHFSQDISKIINECDLPLVNIKLVLEMILNDIDEEFSMKVINEEKLLKNRSLQVHSE